MKKREYNHKDIEKKWQKEWEANETYETLENSAKPKHYILDMFPYPSGEGLHVGHPRGYIATDVYSRMKRMQGFNVLHPMGWDAFGLPAENFAIKNKVHPRIAVEKNVARFKDQLSIIGLDYDWKREINTTDPEFYKWTQWIFLQMFKKGLAYESFEPINWCPSCQTGLANEDVEADGTCERCGTKVEKKPMRQWVLKITDYADRMLADLDKLPKWPEGVKLAQRNWIGKSEGSEIEFAITTSPQPSPSQKREAIRVFTTRADTLFGVTYVVLAPEHALIQALKTQISNWNEVEKYIEEVKNKSEDDRTNAKKEKTGVQLKGVKAINPANGEEVPVWTADYVLASYGTGAVMAVPAHDERDFEFAQKYNLPIKQVIEPVFIDTDFPFQEGKKTVARKAVVVILENTKGEIGLLQWKGESWKNSPPVNFIVGGVEGNETFEQAAMREITEETGYKNFEKVKASLFTARSKFFAAHKDVNRDATFNYIHYRLTNEEHEKISAEETKNHDLFWVTKNEVLKKLTINESKFFYIQLFEKENALVNIGLLKNSGEFNNLSSDEAKKKITEFVGGKMKNTYRIKDWVFSRQRYWGEPIPIIHCEKCGVVPVPEKDLPVTLPEVEHYEPSGTGESPLATIAEWVNVKCPTCGGDAKRETNTMPQWAGSSWYYLRFIDPKNSELLIDKEKEKKWMPVDVYVGGDHATRHLIYARFWHKFLFDIGAVSTEEPFPRLEFLGFILAEDGRKMSKRWGNIVNPDEMVERFGADAFRLYEMFIGPFENTVPWKTDGVVGTYRFIERMVRFSEKLSAASSSNVLMILHKTIKKVSLDIEAFKFNTAVSSMMICMNEMEKAEAVSTEDFKIFLQLLSPFAPHIAEELWYALGETTSIHLSTWPQYDESKIVDDEVTIALQVNGKVRAELTIPVDMDEETIKSKAQENEMIKKWTDGKKIVKIVYVKGRLVNIVAV
jgi:leucyl-tRNA synthetase